MIAVCLKLDAIYYPVLFVGVLWLMLSVILFVSEMFKQDSSLLKNSVCLKIYMTVFALIIIILLTISYSIKTNKEKEKINSTIQSNHVIEQNNSEFVSPFN